ncbi:putative acyl--CoA ligase YdaB [Mytilus californianus]|uniref:putative acyl--CoA ligase YdaB n=1 Tax=Mytilus californianus TaxID=6549 RepID=UPI002247C9EA|nr:putative acyl--CoA ligase YdaB [Mytilus californianus]
MDNFSISYDQLPMTEPFMHCTIPDRIQYYATNSPDKAAFIIHSKSGSREVITCENLYQQSQTFARGLVHLGIKKSDTIGLFFPNSKEWLVSTFGILMAGAVPLHMSFKYKDGRDIIPVLQILPAFAMEILKRDENEISPRVLATGGVPIPKECAQVVPRFCKEFICIYGTTEMGGVSVKRSQAASDFSDYNIGKPWPGVEMKVVDTEGKTLPQNEVGELFVRNRVAFGGYHKNPDKTNQVLGTDGWYKTDDIAYMNENGDFTVTGRCSDIILCHGEPISPSYIEDEIKIHPAVAEMTE